MGCAQNLGELLVGHGHVLGVHAVKGLNLGIGIVHVRQAVDEPGVAVGPGVQHGSLAPALQGDNHVLHVQHVQHGEQRVAVTLLEVSAGGGHGLRHPLYLALHVLLHQFLVAAQLGGVVASDALVVEGGGVVVERADGEVQDTVVGVGVLQYQLVGLGLRYRLLCRT